MESIILVIPPFYKQLIYFACFAVPYGGLSDGLCDGLCNGLCDGPSCDGVMIGCRCFFLSLITALSSSAKNVLQILCLLPVNR